MDKLPKADEDDKIINLLVLSLKEFYDPNRPNPNVRGTIEWPISDSDITRRYPRVKASFMAHLANSRLLTPARRSNKSLLWAEVDTIIMVMLREINYEGRTDIRPKDLEKFLSSCARLFDSALTQFK